MPHLTERQAPASVFLVTLCVYDRVLIAPL